MATWGQNGGPGGKGAPSGFNAITSEMHVESARPAKGLSSSQRNGCFYLMEHSAWTVRTEGQTAQSHSGQQTTLQVPTCDPPPHKGSGTVFAGCPGQPATPLQPPGSLAQN